MKFIGYLLIVVALLLALVILSQLQSYVINFVKAYESLTISSRAESIGFFLGRALAQIAIILFTIFLFKAGRSIIKKHKK